MATETTVKHRPPQTSCQSHDSAYKYDRDKTFPRLTQKTSGLTFKLVEKHLPAELEAASPILGPPDPPFSQQHHLRELDDDGST